MSYHMALHFIYCNIPSVKFICHFDKVFSCQSYSVRGGEGQFQAEMSK